MGTLRLILALSVVYGHAGDFLGFNLVPGDTAVQAFYAVSGFYMTLVLNEKYTSGSSTYGLFMSNRFGRLLPTNLVVLLLTLSLGVLLAVLSKPQLNVFMRWQTLEPLTWPAAIYLIGSQIFLVAQDLYMFLKLDNGVLLFNPDFIRDPKSIHTLLLVPQAWTLGVEIWFYLIAPFIVRRPLKIIVLILIASLAFRLVLQFGFGFYGDPWSYRFFPSELALFLAGAVAYQVYAARNTPSKLRFGAVLLIVAVAIGICLLVNRWQGIGRIMSVGFLVVAICTIPSLFVWSKDRAIDRYLGELSYPLYISHMVVIWAFDSLAAFAGVLRGVLIVVAALVLSAMLYAFIDRPVDRWRQSRIGAARQVRLRPSVGSG